ncbi:MAG: pitrilysin family protein [Nitrospira sp.]|nr:insulinase family protein [Candidatus Manganitrophaceae bacterium]HIL34127.1 insulinase family protein [Candidatus Manganitrophaceae bacterium]
MKKLLFFVPWLILTTSGVGAQTLADRVIEYTLSNGLRVLMVERHQVPTVSFRIVYNVGSTDEVSGITGVAHLYEHMAFKGTRTLGTSDFEKEEKVLAKIEKLNDMIVLEERKGSNAEPGRLEVLKEKFTLLQEEAGQWVVPNEVGEIYDRNGAVGFNASTSRDVTSYIVSLPANRVPLWIAIESDRMANPVLREFYKERDVVLEERRMSVETSPIGKLYETFLSTAFVAHPYGYPTLGWPSDVGSLSATKTALFFKTYYAPNNTIIALVGDFKAAEVLPLLEASFGTIPSGPLPPKVVTVEPPQRGERRVEVEDESNPRLLIGYHKPNLHHPDDAVFDVIDSLLSMGRTSRLYKKLVKEEKVAVSVSSRAGSPGARYPSLFTISATPRAPHTTLELEEAIYAVLERLKTEPPTEKELQKVITNIDASLIRSLRSNSGLAAQLSYFEAVADDWRYTLRNRDAIAKVTGEDVMRVARTYFIKKSRTVATLVQQEKKSNDKEIAQ